MLKIKVEPGFACAPAASPRSTSTSSTRASLKISLDFIPSGMHRERNLKVGDDVSVLSHPPIYSFVSAGPLSRKISYGRFSDYVRKFRPNLRNKRAAEVCCNTCVALNAKLADPDTPEEEKEGIRLHMVFFGGCLMTDTKLQETPEAKQPCVGKKRRKQILPPPPAELTPEAPAFPDTIHPMLEVLDAGATYEIDVTRCGVSRYMPRFSSRDKSLLVFFTYL